MAIILKANKVNLFVSSVLFVFLYHSPNFFRHTTYLPCSFFCTLILHNLLPRLWSCIHHRLIIMMIMIYITQYILQAAMFVERYTDVTVQFTFPILLPTKIVRVVRPHLVVMFFQFLVATGTCCKATTLVFCVSLT
jgi:hypothetical protein